MNRVFWAGQKEQKEGTTVIYECHWRLQGGTVALAVFLMRRVEPGPGREDEIMRDRMSRRQGGTRERMEDSRGQKTSGLKASAVEDFEGGLWS